VSVDYGPAAPARSPRQLRANLAIILISWGIFGSLWWNAVLGAPYTAFAVQLGADPLMLGFLSAAAVLGVVGQILSAYLIERTGRRKAIFLVADLIQRPLWVLVGALPFLIPARYGHWRVIGLLLLTLMSSLLGNTGSPAWVSWMAHVIPQRIRARFLGARYRLATATGVITALVVGKVLDIDSSYRTFFAVFALAALMGTVDILLFTFMPRRQERPSPQPPSLPAIILIPWSDRSFRHYLYYVGSSAACYGIMGQFLTLYFLEGIHLGKFYTNLYLFVIPLLIAASLGPMIGRRITDYGNRPVLAVATVLAAPIPLLFGAAQHNNYALLVATGVLAGIVTGVVGIAELNMLFALTPAERRSAYLAGVALVAGLVGAAAPMIGGIIAQALTGWHATVAGMTVTNLHVVFLLASLLRIIHAIVFVPRLPEPAARTASELMADVFRGPGGVAGAAVRRLRRR
jgi:MFS family permease